jgi:alkanesulfonate monooxygenase SsuD/methylene tetrahydromethanopterin reductase-like flavin-dependent oxidoreductase (luciferase family)
VGTDFDAIVRSVNITAVVGDSDADVQARQARIRDRMVPFVGEQGADAMTKSTEAEIGAGTPEKVAENLRELRGAGCEYVILYFPEAAYDRSGVELFEKEVVPALR